MAVEGTITEREEAFEKAAYKYMRQRIYIYIKGGVCIYKESTFFNYLKTCEKVYICMKHSWMQEFTNPSPYILKGINTTHSMYLYTHTCLFLSSF